VYLDMNIKMARQGGLLQLQLRWFCDLQLYWIARQKRGYQVESAKFFWVYCPMIDQIDDSPVMLFLNLNGVDAGAGW